MATVGTIRSIDLEDRVVARQLRRAAERSPDKPFIVFADRAYHYAAFDSITNSVANTLSRLGLAKGGKVALLARNSAAFVETWFAAAKLGALYVPINTEYKGEVLRYQLNHAEVTHLVIDPEFVDRLAAVVGGLPCLKHVIVTAGTDTPDELRRAAAIHPFASLRAGVDVEPDVKVRFDDPLAISFTSGTTGPSKGVLVVNAHVVTFALDWIRYMEHQPGETIYTPLPLFHAIGAWLGVLPTVLNESRIVVAQKFSASTYWDEVRAARADIAHGIFSMVPILLKQPKREDDATQPARAYYNGNQNPEFEARFNCRIVEAYGATETGMVACTGVTGERVPNSCGKANIDTFDVAVVDENDQPVPSGQVGEIVVRPRLPYSILKEYYRRPDATAETFRNCWFHSGDNGRIDADGNLFFIDRKKDAIRRRGENISSYELEFAMNRHPAVLESAAVSVPSELGEDDVKIVVVPRAGEQLTAEEVWDFCIQTMPRFWIPAIVEFRDELPKTGNLKVQKFQLKERGERARQFVRDWKSGQIREV